MMKFIVFWVLAWLGLTRVVEVQIFGYLEVPVAGHQVSDTIDPQEFVLRPVVPRRRKNFYP